jgi:hypothetical protein
LGGRMRTQERRGLTDGTLRGMYFIQKYRFLTIAQFARIAGVSNYYAGQILLGLEARNIVGYFGATVIPGHGKTPKVYFLKRRGWETLQTEGGYEAEEIGPLVEVYREFAWSPQMYHRLRLLDLFVSLELAVGKWQHLSLPQTFIEYRRTPGTLRRETTDYVSALEAPQYRIVPDGAFILENAAASRRSLFFVEMDMGTERITAKTSADPRATIRGKFEQYDRYLTGGRFAATYAAYGAFRSFTLLFVTLAPERIENIRLAMVDLPERLHGYYRLALFQDAVTDLLGPVWKTRAVSDTVPRALVQEPVTNQ